MALRSGEQLGPYEVVSPLGAGGMGDVYRARDPRLGRDVALKVLPEDVSDPPRLRRFEDEARAVAALNHPHILAVYDIGHDGDSPYVVFELLEGQTLRDRLRRGALPPRKVVEYAEQFCQGLAAAHARGIVHRDLKPANIFLTKDGPLKILDFGLARLTRERPPEDGTAVTETRPDVVLGTLGYLSPEQAQGKKADARSDVFAVGAVLYEMLSGKRAFQGETTAEALVAVLKEDPPEMSSEAGPIPPALDRIVRRCLEKEPDDRFQSAKDVAFALEAVSGSATDPSEVLGAAPQRPRWAKWIAAAATAVALFAAGLLTERVLTRTTPPSITQLTFQRGIPWDALFTPDGQSIVYAASWDGRPSQVYSERLDSLESASLNLEHFTVASISSTAELALIRAVEHNVGAPQSGMLARVNLGSSSVREVLDNVQDADWMPDGDLLGLRRVERLWQLEWPLGQVVRTWPAVHWHPPRVSSAGDAVAYLDPSGELHFLDRSGRDTRAHGDSVKIQSFSWHPKKDEVWYTTWPLGPAVQLRAVDSSGRDRLVHHFGHSVQLLDVSTDGRALVVFWSPARLYSTRVHGSEDQEGRDISFHYRTFPLALSTDAKSVLLRRGVRPDPEGGYYVRSMNDGSTVRIRGFDEGEALDLTPDGRRVLFLESSPQPRIVAVPVGAGEPEPIPLGPIVPSGGKWFPDGTTLLVKGREEGPDERLFVMNPESQAPSPLPVNPQSPSADLAAVHIAPDGRRVAVHDGWTITLYPIDGGEPSLVSGYAGDDPVLGWSADGEALILRQRLCGAPARLFRLDLGTGRQDWLRDVLPPDPTGIVAVHNPVFGRDGESFAYSYVTNNGNLFLVEGLE